MPAPRPDPRFLAVLLLTSIITDGVELETAFTREAALDRLEPRDRGFTRHLVLTALRHYGELSVVLSGRVKRMPKEMPLVHAMLLGAAQLLFLDTPPHAAVNSMVTVTKRLGFVRQAGMVNAVLKNIAAARETLLAARDPARNLPEWLRDRLIADYGDETMRGIAAAQQNMPPLDLTPRRTGAWPDEMPGETLATGSRRIRDAGDIPSLPGFAEGGWWVQDAAAALPARLLGDVAGKQVLDLCAAPGGKTLQLAAAGAAVTALDRSASRLKRLEENLARTGLSAEVVCADAMSFSPEKPFDAVLLDAPCTATGTMRRHPDVAYHRSPKDVTEMTELQRALLEKAAGWLKPGGRLAYSVCSLLHDEGEHVAAAFDAAHPDFSRLDIHIDGVTQSGRELRLLPSDWADRGGIDGFYMTAWDLRL